MKLCRSSVDEIIAVLKHIIRTAATLSTSKNIKSNLAEAVKTGDMTKISDLNQVGVKKPQMTTGSRMCLVLAKTGTKDAAHLNNQKTEPEAKT